MEVIDELEIVGDGETIEIVGAIEDERDGEDDGEREEVEVVPVLNKKGKTSHA